MTEVIFQKRRQLENSFRLTRVETEKNKAFPHLYLCMYTFFVKIVELRNILLYTIKRHLGNYFERINEKKWFSSMRIIERQKLNENGVKKNEKSSVNEMRFYL